MCARRELDGSKNGRRVDYRQVGVQTGVQAVGDKSSGGGRGEHGANSRAIPAVGRRVAIAIP
jgi:hypothetical protein